MQKTTLKIVRAGVIGALYIVLSLITFSFSGGAIQLRIAEGLTLLPLIYPESIPALFVGCLIFNQISGLALYDVLLGSLITLVASIFTYLVGKFVHSKVLKIVLGGLFPVLLNAFFLPVIWLYFSGGLVYVYGLSVLSLIISQSISVYSVGTVIYLSLDRLRERHLRFLD